MRDWICCPEIDVDGYGNPNLPRSSCEMRQDNPELRSCYGGCKGKPPNRQISRVLSDNDVRRSKLAKPIHDKIEHLRRQGWTYKEIADAVNRHVKTVHNVVKARGLS